MTTSRTPRIIALLALSASITGIALARGGPPTYEIPWSSIDGGGGTSSAGAYAMSMSSNYNARPRACEVLVDGEEAHLVRRRETVEALFEGESLLP